jgi:hypothetical protein
MKIGYARISTDEQSLQDATLTATGFAAVFRDCSVPGNGTRQPEWRRRGEHAAAPTETGCSRGPSGRQSLSH